MAINIENIMQDIRNEIKEKGYTYDMLSFKEVTAAPLSDTENVSIADIEKDVNYMENASAVAAYRPLGGSKLAVFIKKIIRKLIKFYVEPIVESQNDFNSSAVRSLNSVVAYMKQQSPDENDRVLLKELNDKVTTLEMQLKTANSEIQMLNERINSLKSSDDGSDKPKAE